MQLMYVVMGKKFMVDAYSFELSDKFLTQEEQLVFDDYLHSQELDRADGRYLRPCSDPVLIIPNP
jgi:hypothetical protein